MPRFVVLAIVLILVTIHFHKEVCLALDVYKEFCDLVFHRKGIVARSRILSHAVDDCRLHMLNVLMCIALSPQNLNHLGQKTTLMFL
jgi:hypothetical protein